MTAARNIGLVASYGTIGAAISAGGSCPASSVPPDDPAYVACGVIDLMLAHGDIAGSIAAQNEIHAVHAAGIITAAITAPVIEGEGDIQILPLYVLADLGELVHVIGFSASESRIEVVRGRSWPEAHDEI